MAQQAMTTQTQRIGALKGEILKHAVPKEVLGRYGVKKPMPKNSSETIKFRRWLPKGATTSTPNTWNVDPATHRLSEGETSVSDTIIAQDINATLVEYGFSYRWSNRVEDLYEDDVPPEIKRLAGERMGLLLEMVRWGVLKAGTNVFRAAGVSARSSINGLISAGMLRNIARAMESNLADPITGILDASVKIGTLPVEEAFVVVCHTDLIADLRAQLSGFIHVSEYGTRTTLPREIGSWENFRFVTSPHLSPYLQAGANEASAGTRLSNGVQGSSNACDVYPMIVLGMEAFGDVALRGTNAMKVNMIGASTPTKDDIHGQRGILGCQTYFTSVRLNEGHMAVYEVAASYSVA